MVCSRGMIKLNENIDIDNFDTDNEEIQFDDIYDDDLMYENQEAYENDFLESLTPYDFE